jgi:hypothetical protein
LSFPDSDMTCSNTCVPPDSCINLNDGPFTHEKQKSSRDCSVDDESYVHGIVDVFRVHLNVSDVDIVKY